MKAPDRLAFENREEKYLAKYAALSSKSQGRKFPEDECVYRSCFYRDLGRIVHSTAFRLLEYKTQVFINSEGDYYRTRLTHSLETSQISVGLSRILNVNEDLAQTIALAHDLGHPPFGHPGEVALNILMKDDGGFEHNYQGYKIITELEERYPHFPGLNLSYEVLEGIIKHSTDYDKPPEVANFKDSGYPTLEAQIVNFADQIAFMNHDLDDGLHWGMLDIESLKEVPLWKETFLEVSEEYKDATDRIKRCRTISNLIDKLITDLQRETKKRIKEFGIETLEDVRKKGKLIVSFSPEMEQKTKEAKKFLLEKVYHHKSVEKTRGETDIIIRDLFRKYCADPKKLPEKYFLRIEKDGLNRAVCDYIAGMTDRFAVSTHRCL